MVLDALDELSTGFEGCEKKVEIDFHLSSSQSDLRHIPRLALDSILDLAKCTIISVQRNADFDAYVLSESSLFIYASKIMLKTCGTTLLLKCVSALLSAARALGAAPDFLQFSRSNFLFPSKQHFPHRAFNEETDYLNEQLGIKGDAFILGSLKGARWHLYIWDFNELHANVYQQQTLEVIMFNLNTDKMKTFYQSNAPSAGVGHPCCSGAEATRVSGIDQLLPGSKIDSHLFSPCGYSCNGCVDVKDVSAIVQRTHGKSAQGEEERKEQSRVGTQGKYQQAYFTIHITPEPECSFVSFETNAVLPSYTALVRHVVELFQPGSFCVSLFVDGGSDVSDSRSGLSWEHPGYITKGTTHHAFQQGYNATVAQFEAAQSEHLHLAPQFGAHALNNELTSSPVQPPVSTPPASGVVPFSSPRSSPLSAQLILSGLNGLPSSYETVTSLSHEQMRSVVLEIAKQKHIDVQTPPSFSLNDAAQSSSPLLTAARSLLALSPDVGFSVVDLGALVRRFHQWSQQCPRVEPVYAMDGNALPAGVALALSALGCHFAVHSASALQHLLAVPVPASRLIFDLPLKSQHQLQYAHSQHVEYVTASSAYELQSIAQVHDSAKVLLRVVTDGIGFTEDDVGKAVALAKELDLSVVGVHVAASAGVGPACERAARVLALAAESGERLSLVHLAELPSEAFSSSSSLAGVIESSFSHDVRVLSDSREFLDVDLAITLMRVLADRRAPSHKRVAYLHPAVAVALTKRCRVEAIHESKEGAESKEATELASVLDSSYAAVEGDSAAVGDWLHCYSSAAQLERLSAAGIDSVPCHFIAS